jgi:hypothetical protein
MVLYPLLHPIKSRQVLRTMAEDQKYLRFYLTYLQNEMMKTALLLMMLRLHCLQRKINQILIVKKKREMWKMTH